LSGTGTGSSSTGAVRDLDNNPRLRKRRKNHPVGIGSFGDYVLLPQLKEY
jgi:hypothetical protein